ncbi:MAG: pentapeptide repeat-containing protein, partial [Candidatus Schekmanbacteria bacterium]|nr:pentapeptide repeat-containing protein [Candidatus Schekmanbacteria bacterium]
MINYIEPIINILFSSVWGNNPPETYTISENSALIQNHPALKFYIPLKCADTIYSQHSDIDLEEKALAFLQNNSRLLLLLGNSGAGKTTFCRYLTLKLIDGYLADNQAPLPLYLDLGSAPKDQLITTTLNRAGLNEAEIESLRKKQKFIFILDAYDEYASKGNLLNQFDKWQAKIIISCRNRYLTRNEEISLFTPLNLDTNVHEGKLLKPLYIASFSPAQLTEYLKKYAAADESPWKDWKQYLQKIDSSHTLKGQAANPLLLYLIVSILPGLSERGEQLNNYTRDKLYQAFFELQFSLGQSASGWEKFFHLAQDLAFAMFLAGKNQTAEPGLLESYGLSLDNTLSSLFPIQKCGENALRFIHQSFQEYFAAHKLYSETINNKWENLNKKLLTQDPAIIYFMAEMKTTNDNLLQIIEKSKNNTDIDKASANAASILNASHFSFSGLNLAGAQIPGADLSDAMLEQTDLTGANLSGTNLRNSFLKDAVLTDCYLQEVEFVDLPYIETLDSPARCLAFSPDGTILAAGYSNSTVILWEAASGRLIRRLSGHSAQVNSLSFNCGGSILASGGDDKNVCLWSIPQGELIATLQGHEDWVRGVCFSPDGALLASGGDDKTVRLWDVVQKRVEGVLSGHDDVVMSVAFNNDGSILASGGYDKTIRLWDSNSGNLINTFNGDVVLCICFSPDGTILAGAGEDHNIRLWDVSSGEIITVLEGH